MTIIVTYQFIDEYSEHEKEFVNVAEAQKWIDGIGDDMFKYVEMSDNSGDVIKPDAFKCIHGKGHLCQLCYPTPDVSKHTLVLLDKSNYAFKDVELQGNEWIDIQGTHDWQELKLCAEGIYLMVRYGTYCFVFFDEADQCSQPYPTVQEAMDARKRYMENL